MKENNTLIIKILIAVLAVALVLYFALSGNSSEKHYQWTETYEANSDQPYGTLFIQKLLASYRPGEKFIANQEKQLKDLLDTTKTKGITDYIFIGQEIFLDSADSKALLDFMHQGNNVFISSVNLPYGVLNPVFVSECDQDLYLAERDTLAATMNFFNKALKTNKGYTYRYRYGKMDTKYFWNALDERVFCDSTKSITPLGFIRPDKVNFFKLAYGKGNLYIHTNPLVFTNYFLTQPNKKEYAAGVFSYLNGKTIIWDELSKSEYTPKNNAPEMNPIAYILQHESLRYAWWLMLAGAVLYAVFTAKRKQRVIPVLEEKANTSLEFVSMIAALHFRNGNDHDIARKKMRYFFYFIRARYGIQAQSLTEPVIKRLAEKSKTDRAEIDAIAAAFNQIDNRLTYSQNSLKNIYTALEKFYKNSN